jgi:hypothetical protein
LPCSHSRSSHCYDYGHTTPLALGGVFWYQVRATVATFLGFLVAEAGFVVRRDWLRPGLSVAATGLIAVGLMLVKPPLWVNRLITLGSLAGLWWIYRSASRRAIARERVLYPSAMTYEKRGKASQ